MLVHGIGCVCLIVSQSSRKMNHDEDRMSLSKVGTPSTRKKLIWSKLSVIQNSKCYARIMKVLVFTYPMIHHSDMEERLAQEVSRARSSKWHCQWQWQWKWQWQFFWKWNQRVFRYSKKNSGFGETMTMKCQHYNHIYLPRRWWTSAQTPVRSTGSTRQTANWFVLLWKYTHHWNYLLFSVPSW